MISAMTTIALLAHVAALSAPTPLELELAERLGEAERECALLASECSVAKEVPGGANS